ncbi:MAG TPA: hypothetical protein VIV57_26165 [Anaeromyxobacter sp.]
MPEGLRAAVAAVLAAVVLVPASGRAGAEVKIAWDPDLAFEWDRKTYERTLRETVQRGFEDASAGLGLAAPPPSVHVVTRARYEARFGTADAFDQGARYERGAIWVNGGRRLDDRFAGLLVHEMTHAVLDGERTGHLLPTWVNEGLAERLSWKRRGLEDLAPNQVWELKGALGQGRLLPLPARGYLSPFGYLQAYAAVLFLERKLGRERLLAVVRRTLGGEPFERALDAEARLTLPQLERELASWVDHL